MYPGICRVFQQPSQFLWLDLGGQTLPANYNAETEEYFKVI